MFSCDSEDEVREKEASSFSSLLYRQLTSLPPPFPFSRSLPSSVSLKISSRSQSAYTLLSLSNLRY